MAVTFDSLTIEKMSSSLVESFMFIRPMFDLKPNVASRNTTQASLYSHVFGFESIFQSKENADSVRVWMQGNWTLSVGISLVYCTLVFLGKWAMSERPKYDVRLPLVLWNVLLASFSILGTIRVLPEFTHILTTKGVTASVCNASYAYGIPGFWAFIFVLSKVPELVDTLFIILRKQQLIFLHWYHHATVLVYCWFSYREFASTGRWFMTMNYFVHSMMYSYYACKALRIRVPALVSQVITTSQIVQMIAGCYVNYVAYTTKAAGATCNISTENIFYSSLMYLSYFVLFFHFFLNAYVFKRSRGSIDTAQVAAAKQVLAHSAASSDFNNNQLQNSVKHNSHDQQIKLKKRN